MRDLVQQSVSSLETTTVTRESPFVKQYPNNKYPAYKKLRVCRQVSHYYYIQFPVTYI